MGLKYFNISHALGVLYTLSKSVWLSNAALYKYFFILQFFYFIWAKRYEINKNYIKRADNYVEVNKIGINIINIIVNYTISIK